MSWRSSLNFSAEWQKFVDQVLALYMYYICRGSYQKYSEVIPKFVETALDQHMHNVFKGYLKVFCRVFRFTSLYVLRIVKGLTSFLQGIEISGSGCIHVLCVYEALNYFLFIYFCRRNEICRSNSGSLYICSMRPLKFYLRRSHRNL